MSDGRRRSVGSTLLGYASVFTGDVGRLIVFAAFIPLLVRVIDSGDYGRYALIMAAFMVLRKALNLGLFDATKTYAARTDDRERKRIVVTALAVQLAILVVTLPILYAGIQLLPVDTAVGRSLEIILVVLVGEQLFNFGRSVLHSGEREAFVEALVPVRSVILAVIGLTLVATGYGLPGVFGGFAVGFVLTGLVATGGALYSVGVLPSPPRPSRPVAIRLVRFGVPSMTLILLTAGLYKIDIFLVSILMTPADTGAYRAALQVAEFIWVASLSMELVMIQTTSPLWRRDERDSISELTAQMLTYVVVATTLLVVGVFALGDEFLHLYFGPEYATSVGPLRILLPGVLGFAIARTVWPVLQAGGYLRPVVGATAVATVGNLLLNLAFIPLFGIAGAAIATSLSYGAMALFHCGVARRVGVYPFSGLPVGRIGFAGVLTAIVLLAANPLFAPSTALVVLPVIGGCVYVTCIFGTGVLSLDETTAFLSDGIDRIGNW